MKAMCGRFSLYADPETLARQFGLELPPVLVPRYNIAPTQPVGIVRVNPQTRQREWALVLWGLIPSWANDPAIGARMINARAESAPEKPAFRAAFKRRRCLLPASGFYEWQKLDGGKQPHHITAAGGELLAFAGLWEIWRGPDGGELETCTILTTEANAVTAPIHDRMPVILAPADYAAWLGTGADATSQELTLLRFLLQPSPAEGLQAYPVSPFVNSSKNEGERCVVPAQ
jgi:putative SOS response-associated peptidase YedK